MLFVILIRSKQILISLNHKNIYEFNEHNVIFLDITLPKSPEEICACCIS